MKNIREQIRIHRVIVIVVLITKNLISDIKLESNTSRDKTESELLNSKEYDKSCFLIGKPDEEEDSKKPSTLDE